MDLRTSTIFGPRRHSFRWHLGVLGVTLVTLLLTSCGVQDPNPRDPGPQDDIGVQQEGDEQQPSAGPESGVSLLELSRNPEQFYGHSVTVSGTVARAFEPGVFSMVTNEVEENEEPVEDEAVIVLNNDGSEARLQEEATIQATGEVAKFDPSELEKNLGINLSRSPYLSYEGQPAILASSVQRMQLTTSR